MNTQQILTAIENARINANNANNTVQYLRQRIDALESTLSRLAQTCAHLELRLQQLEQVTENEE